MAITIAFGRQTVKTLSQELQAAFRLGDLRRVKRSTALVLLADDHPAATVAERLGVARSTVYTWLHAFVVDRWVSLRRRTAPGRPAKLTPTQKQRLRDLVTAVPKRRATGPGAGPVRCSRI